MKGDEIISVIIPVFNARKHINQCIKCLVKQSYSCWEAVFVNDGSTDDTLLLLLNYAKGDERIKVYSQTNQGAAKAREYGLNKISGKYVTFLDADDTLNTDTLQKMVNAFDEDVDIVVSGFNIVKRDKIVKRKILKEQTLDSLPYLKGVFCGKFGWELWAKMYRRELFSQPIETPVGIRIGEDAAVFMQLVTRAKSIRILSEQFYNYIQFNESASHTKSLKYAEETLEAAFFIEAQLKKTVIYEKLEKDINAMFLLFYSNSSRKGLLHSKHPLIYKMVKEHFTLSAFMQIPFFKAVYIYICYIVSHFV